MISNYMARDVYTAELVEIIKAYSSRYIEACLSLGGQGHSTHWLSYNNNTKKLYDTGCDGETRKVSLTQFIEDYKPSNCCSGRWWVRKNSSGCPQPW